MGGSMNYQWYPGHMTKAKRMMQENIKLIDLVIELVDARIPLSSRNPDIDDLAGNKSRIILLNKSDLDTIITLEDMEKICEDFKEESFIIQTSMTNEIGLKELEEKIKEMFSHGKIDMNEQVTITNIRHKEALNDAKDSLILVKQSLADDMPEDFYSIDLMNAYTSLGLIIGEEVEDDLVQEIFSKFCMGK
jgi:tRNA modification GTPase